MTYVALHLALAAALIGLRPGVRLKAARLCLALALAAPLLLRGASAPTRWESAPAQVWSGASFSSESKPAAVVAVSAVRQPLRFPPASALWLALLAVTAAFVARDALALRRKLRAARVVRRVRRLTIAVGGDGPWTAALGLRAWIVLDPATLADRRLRRLALLHELQHLRQRDALWAWALAALQPFFLWTPLARRVRASLVAIEELACDAAVVRSGRVAARTYAAALLDVAERGLGAPIPALPALHGHSLLRRRIEMLIAPVSRRPWLERGVLALSLSLACAGARISGAAVADHRVDLARAQQAAQRVPAAEFPVAVNDVVVEQLNRFVATPGGLRFVQAALARRPQHLAAIHAALADRKLPPQLDAVPLVETGYENVDAGVHGAGLWQFVKPTALHYGLAVTPERDERMDPALESSAAARYLADLYAQFGDWPLALAAYTEGETRVRKLIEREGTRDCWELIRRGALTPYPARVMAAALVIADPSLAGR